MSRLPDDIEIMIRYLGPDDPAVGRLRKAAVRNSNMLSTVRNLLKRRCAQTGFDPDDPPTFWPVRQLPPGFVSMGQVVQGVIPGPTFALTSGIITQHIGLFGHNGTGKSFLAMHLALEAIRAGHRVWVIDIEDEYSRLAPMLPPGKLVALEPEQLRFNFFQPPGPWLTPASWIDEISLLLRGMTFMREGSTNLFRSGMAKLLERKGIAAGSNDWPSLTEVIEHCAGMSFGPKLRGAGWSETLQDRLGALAIHFENLARVTTSDMLTNLAGRSVIFRLHKMTGVPLQFLVGFLLLWLARFREGARDEAVHVVIIEEAHMLSADKARQDIGENILSRMFRTARKRGIALALCDQVPSELPPAILGNLACRVVMRLVNAPCIWSVQTSMGLQRGEGTAIPELEPRHAVAQYQLHPTPFMIQVQDLDFAARPDEADLLHQAQALAAGTEWRESGEQTPSLFGAKKTEDEGLGGLSGDVLQVMVRICEAPAETIEQRCEHLRMDRAREFRARGELDTRGFVVQAEQTLGGRIKFFRPSDKGLEWAQKHSIRVKKFKSGIVHEYILCEVEKHIGQIGPRWALQRNSSIAREQGLQPDLLVKAPDGQRIIVEVCCNNVEYDAKNMLAEAAIDDVDQVIAITPDQGTKRAVDKALKKLTKASDTGAAAPVTVLVAAECFEEDFDWSAILVASDQSDPQS